MTTGGGDEPYSVGYTEDALAMLEQTADRRVRGLILDKGDALAHEPTKVGKPLVGELSGYRSIRAVGQRYRAVGQRYRIVYRVDESARSVWIVAVGLRKQGSRHDVYRLLSRLVERAAETNEG